MPHSATNLEAWKPYQPSNSEPWGHERVVHLHRRAAFGAPWQALQRDLSDGPDAAIDRLLTGNVTDAPADFESLAASIGDAAMASGNAGRLKAWWIYRMLLTPDPLRERFALIWHNHFATSNRKVQNLVMMRGQNELFRKHAFSPFGELLSAVVKHPAMLVWLDADSNRKGKPNENLSRELMELFTLGLGNYSEDDVREAARALTGWTVAAGEFSYRETRHDEGKLDLLGSTGPLTGDGLLSRLVNHPATANRIAWRLCQALLGEELATPDVVGQLAGGLREHQLDIRWGVELILRSELFFSRPNLRTRVAGPAEWTIGTLRSLAMGSPPPSTLSLAEWLSRMGQDLFYPPNVGGWNEGRTWLSSRSIVARANFAEALTVGELWRPKRRPTMPSKSGEDESSAPLPRQVARLVQLLWGEASPDKVNELLKLAAKKLKTDPTVHDVLALILTQPESYLN